MADGPFYQRIADDFRDQILDGTLPGETKLPSEKELEQRYGVSRIVVKHALDVLKAEGLVIGRQGKGVYIRKIDRLVRESPTEYSRTPPPRPPTEREYASNRDEARPAVAERLGIAPGDPVMRTQYRYLAAGEPIQIATSWEPLAITGGTAVERPEESAVTGVTARMEAIGVRVDRVGEALTCRPATNREKGLLSLGSTGAYVVLIERTHYAQDQPVETCDLVYPGHRYEFRYAFTVT